VSPRSLEVRREDSRRWRKLHPGSNAIANKRWRDAHPEEVKRANRDWRHGHPAEKLLHNAKNSARKRGHACTITLVEIEQLLAPMRCAEWGLPLKWDPECKHDPFMPSLDRLDNDVGYISGNVRVVCWLFNRARGDLPIDEFRAIMQRLGVHSLLEGMHS
jgi:hypothetical protein